MAGLTTAGASRLLVWPAPGTTTKVDDPESNSETRRPLSRGMAMSASPWKTMLGQVISPRRSTVSYTHLTLPTSDLV